MRRSLRVRSKRTTDMRRSTTIQRSWREHRPTEEADKERRYSFSFFSTKFVVLTTQNLPFPHKKTKIKMVHSKVLEIYTAKIVQYSFSMGSRRKRPRLLDRPLEGRNTKALYFFRSYLHSLDFWRTLPSSNNYRICYYF